MVLAQNVVSNQRFCRASGVRRRAPRLVMEPSETLVETPCLGKPLPVGDLFVELSAGLADGADIEALLQRFLVPLLRLSGARAGAVRALSEDGSHMRLVGSVGLSQEVLAAEQSVDRHCGVCGQAANQGVLVWAADLKPCTQRSHGDYFGNQCKRLLAVPLRHRDQVLGVYNLFFDSDGKPGPDITAVLRSVGELLGLALHNARLEREHLRAAVLHERQMLANEVHDAVAQTLYFMNMRLPLLHDALLQHDDTRALRYHADLRQAVSDAYASLREILTHYRTRMDPKGLLHALQALQAGYRDRTGIELVLDNRAGDLCLSVDQELQVFHIVQEALANVLKHSRAHKAQVLIEPSQERLVITIEDDGAGLLPAAAAGADAPHFGLEIMCERAQRLGGSLSIHSADGGGTCVQLSIPRARAEAGPRP
jgi:two-component system nitrate/nitrite sensor histidine kinase NarX